MRCGRQRMFFDVIAEGRGRPGTRCYAAAPRASCAQALEGHRRRRTHRPCRSPRTKCLTTLAMRRKGWIHAYLNEKLSPVAGAESAKAFFVQTPALGPGQRPARVSFRKRSASSGCAGRSGLFYARSTNRCSNSRRGPSSFLVSDRFLWTGLSPLAGGDHRKSPSGAPAAHAGILLGPLDALDRAGQATRP